MRPKPHVLNRLLSRKIPFAPDLGRDHLGVLEQKQDWAHQCPRGRNWMTLAFAFVASCSRKRSSTRSP